MRLRARRADLAEAPRGPRPRPRGAWLDVPRPSRACGAPGFEEDSEEGHSRPPALDPSLAVALDAPGALRAGIGAKEPAILKETRKTKDADEPEGLFQEDCYLSAVSD